MQIYTHFNDLIDDVIDTDYNDKILDQVLDPRYVLKKILQYCPKKLKIECQAVIRHHAMNAVAVFSPEVTLKVAWNLFTYFSELSYFLCG